MKSQKKKWQNHSLARMYRLNHFFRIMNHKMRNYLLALLEKLMIHLKNPKLILINHRLLCLEIKKQKNQAYFKVKCQLKQMIQKSKRLMVQKFPCLVSNKLLKVNLAQGISFLILNRLNSKKRNYRNHNHWIPSLANQRKIIHFWTRVQCSRVLQKSRILSQRILQNLNCRLIRLLTQAISSICHRVKNQIK